MMVRPYGLDVFDKSEPPTRVEPFHTPDEERALGRALLGGFWMTCWARFGRHVGRILDS